MRYVTAQDILVIHAKIIDATGGAHGIRDTHLLLSLVERPKAAFGGKEMYTTVFEKAAVYLESLARHHVFIDGNKRTSFVVAVRFLELNEVFIGPTSPRVVEFILSVVNQKLDIPTIAAWLKKYAKKRK